MPKIRVQSKNGVNILYISDVLYIIYFCLDYVCVCLFVLDIFHVDTANGVKIKNSNKHNKIKLAT